MFSFDLPYDILTRESSSEKDVKAMKVHVQPDNSVTLIENIFIDRYMPRANGEFVKLYLYLLRCAGSGQEVSISSIADFFDHTEKDVRRALTYWEKLNLLSLTYDEDDNITQIVFLKGDESDDSGSVAETKQHRSAPQPAPAVSDSVDVPSKSISSERKKQLAGEQEIRQLFFVAEQYLGRPLGNAMSENLIYCYDSLHFSTDLIEYLLEYCAERGKTSARYMEKVAIGWYKDGITTVDAAKEQSGLFRKDYYTILAALGIKGRQPVSGEITLMKRWLDEEGFDLDLICEACERCILNTGRANLKYVDGILSKWKEKGLHTLAEVRTMDTPPAPASAQSSSRADRSAAARTNSNRFTRIPQRDYNWSDLEARLTGTSSAKKGGNN